MTWGRVQEHCWCCQSCSVVISLQISNFFYFRDGTYFWVGVQQSNRWQQSISIKFLHNITSTFNSVIQFKTLKDHRASTVGIYCRSVGPFKNIHICNGYYFAQARTFWSFNYFFILDLHFLPINHYFNSTAPPFRDGNKPVWGPMNGGSGALGVPTVAIGRGGAGVSSAWRRRTLTHHHADFLKLICQCSVFALPAFGCLFIQMIEYCSVCLTLSRHDLTQLCQIGILQMPRRLL